MAQKKLPAGSAQTVWVLTREVNDYDQHGEYFVAVFATLPSIAQLAAYFAAEKIQAPHNGGFMGAVAFLEHLRAGGGRQGAEDVWYNLEPQGVIPAAPAEGTQ